MTGIDQPAPTTHAIERYTRETETRLHGISLCLSGGGYRAALFHLGALTRLNELGILSQVETISSVSGGSIMSGHLTNYVETWPAAGERFADWDALIAMPLRAFLSIDIRTRPLARRLLPWNWSQEETAVQGLAKAYFDRLTREYLDALLDRPRFIFCATDLVFGVNWIFDSGGSAVPGGRVGDYQVGYVHPMPHVAVAQAVAASSCFPPLFDPMPMGKLAQQLQGGKFDKPNRADLAKDVSLSDGGVYDNFGLEPVWKDHQVVLVSDGGGVFEGHNDTGLIWRVSRYVDIQGNQARALRKRWLISNFVAKALAGAYWGIGSSADHYEFDRQCYSAELVDEIISEVRTDLDRFSEAEQAVLENHGYIMAEAAVQRHMPDLIRFTAPFAIPHPDWMDEPAVRAALASSGKRRLFGR